MKNRKGFTLIELMIVIAIIIILAAIAIPNYLKMTERAKKARIGSDMAALATGLEAFRTDWGAYPHNVAAVDIAGSVAVNGGTGTLLYDELGGTGGVGATINVSTATNIAGEKGPIEYIKVTTLTSIVDPFTLNGGTKSDGKMYYFAKSDGMHWCLFAYTSGAAGSEKYLYRTDGSSTVTEDTAANIATAFAALP